MAIENFPTEKIPKDSSWCFFWVKQSNWGPVRLRLKVSTARDLSILANTEVEYDSDQSFPEVGYCPKGSQKAFVYGVRGKPPEGIDP